MKWVLSHTTDEIHHWLLQQQGGSRSLIANLHRLSLRLVGMSKRLFFLQVQGFLHKKILLRSEYGVVIGETSFADKPSPGQLLFNGQRYSYRVEEGSLVLLDNDKNIAGKCEIAAEAQQNKFEFYSLLFGFAWFLMADTAAEKSPVLSITA